MRIPRGIRGIGALVLLCGALIAGGARAQSLTVLPVSITLAPGQMATSLMVVNQDEAETAVQIRAEAWSEAGGKESLTPSDELLASPPITRIPPGARQVVRLVLRKPVQGREATYRILLDQIPPPAVPGIVHVVLRLSIPVFAEPPVQVLPRVRFHIETASGQAWLVAVNEGGRHELVRDIELVSAGGSWASSAGEASPYVLADSTHRWLIERHDGIAGPGGSVQMTAKVDNGALTQSIPVLAPP